MSYIAKKHFVFIGGDNRQKFIKEYLLNYYGTILNFTDLIRSKSLTTNEILNLIEQGNVIIAPLPITSDGISISIPSNEEKVTTLVPFNSLIERLRPDSIIFAGSFTPNMSATMSVKGIKFYDYLKSPCVQTKNAIATAEGTIMKAIENSIVNIHSSNCLILGFGKCAKVLAAKFRALNANVTICARSDYSLCEAFTCGYNTIHLEKLSSIIKTYDYVINTIPAMVLEAATLDKITTKTLIIDIASKPGGIDYEYAYKNNLNTIHYLGIPGKVSPKTSGYILGEYIVECLTKGHRMEE